MRQGSAELLPRSGIPEADLVPAHREGEPAGRAESHGRDRIGVTHRHTQCCLAVRVPELSDPVMAAHQQGPAIGAIDHRSNRPRVAKDGFQRLAGHGVPEPASLVRAAGCKRLAIPRVVGDRGDSIGVLS